MKNFLDGLAGMLMVSADRARNRRTLRRIQEANEQNQGIVRYAPSQIEAFLDDAAPTGDLLISGGANAIRVRAVCRAIECACQQGYSVMVLHAGNSELEQGLWGYFGGSGVCLVNRGNPVYDPFFGASNGEIARLVVDSSEKGCQVHPAGRYYLYGISDYIRAYRRLPMCYMFLKCPHLTFLDRVSSAEAKGHITAAEARSVTSQIMQGEAERGNIEAFFHTLSLQGAAILASKGAAPRAVNLVMAANRQQIFCVDIQSSSHFLLLNLLLHETEAVLSQGKKILVVVDGINVTASDGLKNYVRQSGGRNCALVASDDAYSEFGGSDNDFFAFAGKCSKLIVSKHSSAYSCQKISDAIGSFEKQEVTNAYSGSTSYFGMWGAGSGQTMNVSVKRENIVKPEELQRLEANEVYILDKYSGQLSYAPIL